MEERMMLKDFSKEKFDIIIQAGQSNSEGFGVGPVDEPYQPNEQVWYLNPDFTISMASEDVMYNEIRSTFALSFASRYVSEGLLQEDRKLLIIRAAVGGTGFLDNHWKLEDDFYLRMMEMTRTALSLNEENRLVALLWHQGETDATLKASYEVHYNHLNTLLESVRSEFSVQNLPFIAGDFVHHWRDKNQEICAPILEAIRAVCADCRSGTFVETDELHSNLQEMGRKTQCGPDVIEDDIHFSRKSCYQLGARYFDAYLKLISCKDKGRL